MKKLILILAVLTGTAHAGPDPKAIQKDIDRELQTVESKLSSGAAYDARNAAAKLVELYDKLEDATSGSDRSDAQKGKEDAVKLKDALMALDQLVQNQKMSLELATQCARGQLMIAEAIKSFEKKNDAAAIKLLPEAAESARKLVEKPFADTKRMRSAMDGWYRTAGNFNPKLDVWRDIRGELKEAGDRSYKMFVEAFDKTEETCQRVAKGKDHPEVLAAVKLLKANHGERAADLAGIEKEIKEYAIMIGGFRDWYRKDTDAIADAFCKAGEKWGTSDVDRAPIVAVLDRAKGELSARAKRIEDEHDLLVKALSEAKKVASSPEENKRLTEAMTAIAKVHASFTKAIKDDPVAQGANNPKIRMRMEAGKLAHAEIQNRCTEKEGVIDGSNRVDCIQRCTVVEIKPDTASGRSDGDQQKKRYKEAFEKLFKDQPRFAKQFPRLAKECVKSGKLDLDYDVALYEFCPSSYDDLGFGPSLDARLTNPDVLQKLDLDGK